MKYTILIFALLFVSVHGGISEIFKKIYDYYDDKLQDYMINNSYPEKLIKKPLPDHYKPNPIWLFRGPKAQAKWEKMSKEQRRDSHDFKWLKKKYETIKANRIKKEKEAL